MSDNVEKPELTENEVKSRSVIKEFVQEYRNKPADESNVKWLNRQFSKYPELWPDAAAREKDAAEIVESVEKYQAAKELDIEIEFHITDLSGISIDTTLLVVLLSNLLDNAIEACQQLSGERMINCTIVANDDLFISIKNPSIPVIIYNGLIETTKTPKDEHGYGLITVKHILNHLNAEHTIHYEDGYFQFATEIPTPIK